MGPAAGPPFWRPFAVSGGPVNYHCDERDGAGPLVHGAQQEPVRPENKALLDYWLSLNSRSGLPFRRQIEPRRIPQVLPHLVIIDVKRLSGGAPELFVRLAGTGIRGLLGIEATGRDWLDIVPDDDREQLLARVKAALTQPAGYVERSSYKEPGNDLAKVETLALPMCEQEGLPPSLLLCACVANRTMDLRPLFPSLPMPRSTARVHFLDVGYGLPRL